MIEVSVLYGNLTVERAPITEMGSLRKEGVQAVVVVGSTEVWTDRGGTEHPKDGKLLASAIGHDYYAVCYRGDGFGHWATIVAEDEADFKWRPVEDHLEVRRGRTPLGCLHTWFEGGLVSDAQWAKVQAKYGRLLRGDI